MTKSGVAGVHPETGFALTAEPGADGLVAQVVVAHIYCWLTARPASLGVPGQTDHHRAYRGDTIWVSPQERDRGHAYGGLADPENAQAGIDAVDALAGPVAPGAAGDAELAEMDAGELAGYVTPNPAEAQRVYEFERAQRRPRKTVLRAAGYDPDTFDETTGQYAPLPDVAGSADHLDTSGVGGPAAVG
jgi:hypothetical protein